MTIFSASMAPGESKDERDERVARLWQTLDTRKEGHIDLNGLKKGLKKIDHREFPNPISCRELPINAPIAALKHADGLVQSILREVDTNSDGRIDFDGNDAPLFAAPGAYLRRLRAGFSVIPNACFRVPSFYQPHRVRVMADVPEH